MKQKYPRGTVSQCFLFLQKGSINCTAFISCGGIGPLRDTHYQHLDIFMEKK